MSTPINAQEPTKLQKELNELRQDVSRFQERLDEARTKKQNTRRKLNKTESRESSLLEIIDRYNSELKRVKDRLSELKRKERKARKKYQEAKRKFRQTNSKLEKQKKLVARRLRYAYMNRQVEGAGLLLKASDVSDFMTRMRYYREILNLDQSILDDYKDARKTLRARKKQRKKSLNWLKHLQNKVQETIERKEQILSKRKSVLSKIRNKKSLYKRKLRELENQQQKLKQKVFRLQELQSDKAAKLKKLRHEFGRQKGNLPWPVESREVLRPFGEWQRQKGGPSFENDGIDIGVPSGSAVKVIAPGTVVFARPYTGMGQVVIVRHGGGFTTLYGSLIETKVSQGDELEEGDVVGKAGETSGFRESRLYFQIFRGKQILNPVKWLK